VEYQPPYAWPAQASQPPPDPPELPEGQDPRPRWPWWYGIVALLAGFFVVQVLGGIVYAIAVGFDDISNPPAGLAIGLTLFQDVVLIAIALGFAAMVAKPRAWHFGFVPTPLWRAVGWAALAAFAYLVFAGVYGALVQPDEQTTLEDLGADQLPAVVIGFAVVVVAPFVEEFFFRGFLYRCLRSSLSTIPAALVAGGIFGLVHAASGIDVVPVLGMLGFLLCLLYEKTGSLYPTIFLHALLNTLAFGSATHEWAAALGLGVPTLLSCFLLPRVVPARATATV
jgi:membrane protease YdiL (CAAX protease family)